MSISGMNPRNLADRYARAMRSPAAKVLDWALAIAWIGYTAHLLYSEWPSPSLWAWACVPLGALGIFLAHYDWKSRIERIVHRSMSRRRR